jgi:hypothetical protein
MNPAAIFAATRRDAAVPCKLMSFDPSLGGRSSRPDRKRGARIEISRNQVLSFSHRARFYRERFPSAQILRQRCRTPKHKQSALPQILIPRSEDPVRSGRGGRKRFASVSRPPKSSPSQAGAQRHRLQHARSIKLLNGQISQILQQPDISSLKRASASVDQAQRANAASVCKN